MKDAIAESKVHLQLEAKPLTQEDTQVLVENNIVSQKEAESLLKLEKLLSPESKK